MDPRDANDHDANDHGDGRGSDAPADPADGAARMPEPPPTELDDRDRQILDFEREWWKYAGSKEESIRERFDLSPTRYYQLLNRLIDDSDAAMAYDPMLVKRLRRLRAARQRKRAAKRLGVDIGT